MNGVPAELDGLFAAPSVMLVSEGDEPPHVVVGTDWRKATLPQDASLRRLRELGVLNEGEPPPSWPPDVLAYQWSEGWPEPPGTGALVVLALEGAVVLPSSLDPLRMRVLLQRFLALQPPEVAEALFAAVQGRCRVISLRPSSAVERGLKDVLLELPLDDPTLIHPSGENERCDPAALEGPLSPVRRLSARELGPQHVATCEVLPSLAGLGSEGLSASGVRSTAREAGGVAAAEAYERHVAGVIARSDVHEGRLLHLEYGLSPNDFVAYAPWQLELHRDLVPFRAEDQRVWVAAESSDGRRADVLADLVYYPFSKLGRHTAANSSGMAAHRSVKLATAAAWNELVERDAFLRHWLGRQPGRLLLQGGLPKQVVSLLADFENVGWRLTLVQLGADPTRAIFCAVARRGRRVVLGAAAGEAQQACMAAAREAWVTVRMAIGDEPVPDVTEVLTPTDHRRLYHRTDLGSELDFLDRWCDECVELADLRPSPPIAPSAIVYVWPLATTSPLHVVRVLDASLIPITFGYQREPLGRPDVLALLKQGGLDEHELLPHPFG